ncbi:MAG: sialate O-acetylesterase [Planctomycetia bacterium]|nr:sialate O-acetylesterase [Planctomycetia bacterium]
MLSPRAILYAFRSSSLAIHATTTLCIFAAIGLASPAFADVKLPNVFSSNMVLQRDRPVPVWGTAAADEEVTVSIGDHTASTKAGGDGKWKVSLPAMPANDKPQTMTVSGKNKLELKDILVGEVWVCSGQSNMSFAVASVDNNKKEVSTADYPQIRLFLVHNAQGPKPAADVNAKWVPCSPATVPGFAAPGYFFGRELHKELKVPVGLIAAAWGGRRIEPFTTPEGVKAVPALASKPQHELGIIYNGMLAPIVPYAIRGAIWYQGEANVGEGMLYTDRMKALVASWRQAWSDPEMPFYFVQLAPFRYGGNVLPEFWEAQTASLAIPHTGMAVINDIGNFGNIHPGNKQDVGSRLARWALNRTYGKKDVVASGPLFKSATVDGDKVRVAFAYAGGLKSRDSKPLTEFEIAGADGKYVPAKATIDGETVIVTADAVKEPASVRLGWRPNANPNLVIGAGLPTGSFRSKDWKGVTGE